MSRFEPIETAAYGPLNPKVNLSPDFFTGFEPAHRAEILKKEAAFYRTITRPYAVDGEIETAWAIVPSSDGFEIGVKSYRPKGVTTPLPALIFVHGGGFTTCSVDTHDFVPAYIAARAGIAVFSVEYRLAPEYKFPTGLEDCYTALEWVKQSADKLGVDQNCISVGGDSSGGNFSIALTLMAKQRGGIPLHKQILIYPVTELSNSIKKRSAQVYAPAEDNDENQLLLVYTTPGDDPQNPLISPLFAEDLTGLPPALFIQAECDALLDDGLLYAKRLQDAGVPVEHHIYTGMPHAFILRTYDESFDALNTICRFLSD